MRAQAANGPNMRPAEAAPGSGGQSYVPWLGKWQTPEQHSSVHLHLKGRPGLASRAGLGALLASSAWVRLHWELGVTSRLPRVATGLALP